MEESRGDLLLKAKELKETLRKSLVPGITAAVFCNIEGSPIAQVCQEEASYAALIAHIVEYIDLGQQALNENKLQTVVLENERGSILAKVIYDHVLFFKVQSDVKLGLVMSRLEALSQYLAKQLEPLARVMMEEESEGESDEGEEEAP